MVVLTNTCLETEVSELGKDLLGLLFLVLRQQHGMNIGEHTSIGKDSVSDHLAQLLVVAHIFTYLKVSQKKKRGSIFSQFKPP